MNFSDKYIDAFAYVLQIEETNRNLIKTLKYRDHGWDSVAHMVLMATLEETFDIMLDTDDVIDFSSFEKGREILRRYDVEL